MRNQPKILQFIKGNFFHLPSLPWDSKVKEVASLLPCRTLGCQATQKRIVEMHQLLLQSRSHGWTLKTEDGYVFICFFYLWTCWISIFGVVFTSMILSMCLNQNLLLLNIMICSHWKILKCTFHSAKSPLPSWRGPMIHREIVPIYIFLSWAIWWLTIFFLHHFTYHFTTYMCAVAFFFRSFSTWIFPFPAGHPVVKTPTCACWSTCMAWCHSTTVTKATWLRAAGRRPWWRKARNNWTLQCQGEELAPKVGLRWRPLQAKGGSMVINELMFMNLWLDDYEYT